MKKKATKLLAVVALVTSPAIASADPRPNANTTTANTRANTTANTRANTTGSPTESTTASVIFDESPTNWNAPVSFVDPLVDPLAIQSARPRQMPSGAPACGNVASRAPRRAECEAPAPMLARHRTTTTSIARRAQTATRSRVTGDKP